MGLRLTLTLSLTFLLTSSQIATLFADPLLFLTNQGRYEEVAKVLKDSEKLDTALIEQVALQILRQGVYSRNSEEALLALFGASCAMNEEVETLFEMAWNTPNPPIQLAALNFICKSHSETALHILNQAIGMPHPLIRLEAAFLLAERKAPQASIKIESLMHKIESEAHFLFPQLFAMIGDDAAKKILKKLLIHKDEKVRTEAILAIAKSGRDDLLIEVRKALNHPEAHMKEVAAYAVGVLKDDKSFQDLNRLSERGSMPIKLTALRSLTELHHQPAQEKLEAYARNGDLFAIYALSNQKGSEDTLASLLDHPQANVRLNATLALLTLKDKRSLKRLPELIIRDARDLSFLPISTPAGALNAFRIVPSSRQNLEEKEAFMLLSLKMREQALTATLDLDEESFFEMASLIFSKHQTDLIPLTIDLIESFGGEKAVNFLRHEEQRAGAPFIRAWAALGLFRMKAEGSYEEKLSQWIKNESAFDLINFKPFIPWDKREGTLFELTPHEKTMLWIFSLEALMASNSERAIRLILDLMASGAGKNKAILAGLLLRAIQ